MKRRHQMPFGAEIQDDGSVRFRLWAPEARRVDVLILGSDEPRTLPMQARDSWFELVTDSVKAGGLYRYRIDEGLSVPDPAARFQPQDIDGPSEVIDPHAFAWEDVSWQGRPWEEAVFYELHVGAFTPSGGFAGVIEKLDQLVDLGITAIELMPVADFPGRHNWGYDGTLPFAPDSTYGRPEALKALVQAAHARGLMVFLDVVYNHFGPEGNYLHHYAPQFFDEGRHTAWGAALNFDGAMSRTVRDFFCHNAVYWLKEYNFDGLRLDAVHAIIDRSDPDILVELARCVREALPERKHIHLVLENDHNSARHLARAPYLFDAQWNDDIHHCLHVLLTGEQGGYYGDYARTPIRQLGRCLTEGFAYQGEASAWRDGRTRGEASAHLPPKAFVSFLQNHDQIGNRAFGERITALAPIEAIEAAAAVLLLAPSPPLLFMGQEWAAPQPFLYFCDFHGDLAQAVTKGRRREFARFPAFHDPQARSQIPDPNDSRTFEQSRLDWSIAETEPHQSLRAFHRRLLGLRRDIVMPLLGGIGGNAGRFDPIGATGLAVSWTMSPTRHLRLFANLGPQPQRLDTPPPQAEPFLAVGAKAAEDLRSGLLAPWSVLWFLEGTTG